LPGTSRTIFKGPVEYGEEEEENSVEEEQSDGTEGSPAPVGVSQGTGGPTLAQSYQPFSHQYEPSLLAIMQQMTQIMANIQAALVSDSSSPPAFKTPSMKAPECFDGTQPFKVRSFIQSCQSIFHNDAANSSQYRKKVLYATSFLIGRDAKWIGLYIFNHTNQDPRYLLNFGTLFESQLFTLFGTQMKSLVSRIGDWGERALIHHFRKGLQSRILDQLASHPSRIYSLQNLMEITLELDTRTPSFPYSVHIPSLNSHQSLLSSRDEVFKEIKDVGEDNSLSSLHLFFGNMDISPSSYHDSLQELWDEEEELEEMETVMKVVPSVYHQYLDVFSKVKAEEIPPHCACDHHIELEGSLTPVGVIYSLSKPRVRYTQGLHFREYRESFHPAKLLFNRSTCPLCQK
ncbi:hypothetical protein O181_082912, partial [Austropuccinia psidii MF-1]|nr:hypothetical protein [Austropuccinia psidii MF-1]